MNIGNITSDNFNLDGNGKDIQIEVYEQLIEQLQQENQELKLELSGYRQAILEDKDMLGLKEENTELKKQLEEKNKPQIFIDTQNIEERYAEGLYQDYLEEENKKYKDQQKEFIKYMNKTIEELECDDVDDEEMKGYLIQRIDTFKEILSKYKSIIGGIDENN